MHGRDGLKPKKSVLDFDYSHFLDLPAHRVWKQSDLGFCLNLLERGDKCNIWNFGSVVSNLD